MNINTQYKTGFGLQMHVRIALAQKQKEKQEIDSKCILLCLEETD